MEILGYLATALTPMNLLFTAIGAALGLIVGALPGLTSPMVIVMLLPLTYTMDPLPALLMLMGIYTATKLGGAFPAIMIRTPGTPAAACTTLDGYPMAQRGEGGRALGFAIFSSLFGGVVAFLACLLLAPLVATIALRATSADIALIGLLGLIMVCMFSKGNIVKGLIGVCAGLLISFVGSDPISGTSRFTFGNHVLLSGIPFVAALVGMFAIATVLSDLKSIGNSKEKAIEEKMAIKKVELPSFREFISHWKAVAIGCFYGVVVGVVPGVGAEASPWLAYANAKKASKYPEKFGTGVPEGIIAPETSSNALTGGAMVPVLTLGIPADGSTAIMLGALMLQGLNPGVTLFRDHPALTYGMITGLLTTTLFMFFLAWKLIRLFVVMFKQDRSWIFPFVLVFGTIGAFASTNTTAPVIMAVLLGLLGYFMQKYDYPVVTLVLAIILGPIIETQARLALLFSRGSWSTFYDTPFRIVLLAIAMLAIGSEVYSSFRQKKNTKS